MIRNPIGILIDELKSEDPKRRANSIKSFTTIATAIGPERTRSELIPFASELLDDEDEVLVQLAESLGELSEYVGGKQHVYVLFHPLEKLCYVEDAAVRDQTAQTVVRVVELLDMKKYEERVAKFVRRLLNKDSYAGKSSLCAIIPSIFPQCSPTFRSELIKIYAGLVSDENPVIRKFASVNIKFLLRHLTSNNQDDLINCVQAFVKEEQDFIRVYIAESLVVLGQVLSPEKQADSFINFVKSLAEDQSYRIRCTVAENIYELGQSLGKVQNKDVLLPNYIKFLQDTESELRILASLKLVKFSELLQEDDIIHSIIPCLELLSKDSAHQVRAALADSLSSLCLLIGKKPANEYILPIFLVLLRDEVSEVRMNLFKHLDDLTKIIDVNSLSNALLPAFNDLAADKNWRIRCAAIEFFPFFARKMGERFLHDQFAQILINWLSDRIYGVREAVVKCIKSLIELLGSQWAERQLFPKIVQLKYNQNYLHRMTLLFIVQEVGPLLTHDTLSRTIAPILIDLSTDRIANVRMNTAKALKIVSSGLKDRLGEACKRALIQLADDDDPEVKCEAKRT